MNNREKIAEIKDQLQSAQRKVEYYRNLYNHIKKEADLAWHDVDQLYNDRVKLIERLREALRVTADGSIPDTWDGTTGGAGHAEVRRIIRSILKEIGVDIDD